MTQYKLQFNTEDNRPWIHICAPKGGGWNIDSYRYLHQGEEYEVNIYGTPGNYMMDIVGELGTSWLDLTVVAHTVFGDYEDPALFPEVCAIPNCP